MRLHDCLAMLAALPLLLVAACGIGGMGSSTPDPNAAAPLAANDLRLSDDGAWCWFQDERTLVDGDWLVVGSVAAGSPDSARKGNIEALFWNTRTGDRQTLVLHPALLNKRGNYDDHNAPAFLALEPGKLLAVYAMHGDENRFYTRVLELAGSRWQIAAERYFVPSESSRVTYSNVFLLKGENAPTGRIYNFFRGLDDSFKPSYAWSDDAGESWQSGGVFINVPSEFRHRPYVKYSSDGNNAVHFVYTEGHPRNYNNSVYHAFYRNGQLHRSDGSVIRGLREGLARPEEGTKLFAGDADNVGWTSDLHLDENGHPRVAFTVQKDAAGLPEENDGMDHRYHYARWDGAQWLQYEIGFAGTRLYPKEGDYTGNISLDPNDPSQVFISSNAHPATGEPLISAADGKRHWEISRGITQDGGRSWRWTPLTENSTEDQLRPIVPDWKNSEKLALLWLRGDYRTYTDYSQAVMLRVIARSGSAH